MRGLRVGEVTRPGGLQCGLAEPDGSIRAVRAAAARLHLDHRRQVLQVHTGQHPQGHGPHRQARPHHQRLLPQPPLLVPGRLLQAAVRRRLPLRLHLQGQFQEIRLRRRDLPPLQVERPHRRLRHRQGRRLLQLLQLLQHRTEHPAQGILRVQGGGDRGLEELAEEDHAAGRTGLSVGLQRIHGPRPLEARPVRDGLLRGDPQQIPAAHLDSLIPQ